MNDYSLLEIVKLNLAIAGERWDEFLMHLIETSRQAIAREGIVLKDTAEDNNLVVMYTSYLYKKRHEDIAAMPRMLRWALNNRLFSQKAGERSDL